MISIPLSCPGLREFVPVKTFDELFAELTAKAAAGTPGSGTVAALEKGVHFIGKKVVEEAAESWMAAEHEGRERAAEEISQLLYQVQVLMLATGLDAGGRLPTSVGGPRVRPHPFEGAPSDAANRRAQQGHPVRTRRRRCCGRPVTASAPTPRT